MAEIIEWVNPGPGDIIWRYPKEDIRWGSALVVHEYEAAIFMRDGKLYDVFGPGRHILTTANVPLLTRAYNLVMGYRETPFKATVIFISLKQFPGKFGVKTMVSSDPSVKMPIPLKAHGGYWFRVEDAPLFITQVVGGQGLYTTEDVTDFIRGFISEKLVDELAQYDFMTVFTRLDETTMKVKVNIMEVFRQRGVELIDLKFEGADTDPEYYDKIAWIRQMIALGPEAARYTALKETAKEIAKAPGAGVTAPLVLIPPMVQPTPPAPTPPPAVALILCPNCKAQVPSTSRFCPNCGFKLEATPPPITESSKCPQCGQPISAGAKFCPNCGAKLS